MPQVKVLVAGSLIIGSIAFLMFNGFDESMIYYYRVPEVLAQSSEISDRGIRISGHVAEGSIKRFAGESKVEFLVLDKESEQTLPVVFQGEIPDTFKDHAEVVVEGRLLENRTFVANTLLAKCPSKYERQQEGYETSDEAVAAAEYPAASASGN